MFELRGVGVNFNPFSSNLISVIFNVRFDKLTICISGFVFAMDFCMEFVLGIKNDPYLSLDCIPCFGLNNIYFEKLSHTNLQTEQSCFDNIYRVAYPYLCN